VWDTSLSGHAIAEANQALGEDTPLAAACDWLRGKQVTEIAGDWAATRPGVPAGGWAFQYENAHYPDVDDTAVVGMLLHREDAVAHGEAVARARDWIVGMQCRNGGWGAFDADNDDEFLNHIPFADHGALLDPPTADVTARCLSFLAQLGHTQDETVMRRGLDWLMRQQEKDGSWFGRWGTNYIYGTWSVLCALNACGIAHESPAIRRAVSFLLEMQREDGGWGEDEETYAGSAPGRFDRSTPSQTAWALLGLMAAGEADHPAVARGVEYLARTQDESGEWSEQAYTAVGFPRVFYLRYHGYKQFFPLLALSRFMTLSRRNDRRVQYGF
jgi:squalene-hopene/tetraprenyl-beta-curcumene cyclase